MVEYIHPDMFGRAQSDINRFDGEYSFLSNFHPSPLTYEGINYPTVEHAFQAAKTLDKTERLRISKLPTPGQAKRAGQKVDLQDNWNSLRLKVMEELIYLKFQTNGELLTMLDATKERKLVEGNAWKDVYWGVYRGKGQNHLGKILMIVRKELCNPGYVKWPQMLKPVK